MPIPKTTATNTIPLHVNSQYPTVFWVLGETLEANRTATIPLPRKACRNYK